MSDVLPREVVVLDRSGVLRKDDYPWLVAVRVVGKTAGADGGDAGYILLELYDQDSGPDA